MEGDGDNIMLAWPNKKDKLRYGEGKRSIYWLVFGWCLFMIAAGIFMPYSGLCS